MDPEETHCLTSGLLPTRLFAPTAFKPASISLEELPEFRREFADCCILQSPAACATVLADHARHEAREVPEPFLIHAFSLKSAMDELGVHSQALEPEGDEVLHALSRGWPVACVIDIKHGRFFDNEDGVNVGQMAVVIHAYSKRTGMFQFASPIVEYNGGQGSMSARYIYNNACDVMVVRDGVIARPAFY